MEKFRKDFLVAERILNFTMENVMPPLTRVYCCYLGERISTKSLSAIDKQWLGAQLYYGKISSTNMTKKYGIPQSTLRTYKQKVRNELCFREESGRPPVVDNIAKDYIQESLSGKKYQMRTFSWSHSINQKFGKALGFEIKIV
jgi:hypothetical protein